jgi:hypothetical protein
MFNPEGKAGQIKDASIYLATNKFETKSVFDNFYADLVFQSKEAMIKMPEGKTGLVIGSGGNTKEWNKKGWETLDVEPIFKTNYIGDANRLGEIVKEKRYDYILSENVAISNSSKPPSLNNARIVNSIKLESFLNNAYKILNDQGILIVQMTDSEKMLDEFRSGNDKYNLFVEKNDFLGIMEISRRPISPEDLSLTWYARKK